MQRRLIACFNPIQVVQVDGFYSISNTVKEFIIPTKLGTFNLNVSTMPLPKGKH